MTPAKSLHALFDAALDRDDPVERARFLDEACGTDAALRERVEKLLRAHDEAGGFLSHPLQQPAGAEGTIGRMALPLSEKPGDKIGRYKLLQQIGEGGCGVVYMAEQEDPVRRRVALKIIKLGMDTKQVVARFEAERQALALMDHPNIAKVLDAGATGSGRPFFVMELVRGVRITEFCDHQRLSPRERLELFIQVCSAIQHAHQKGIIHRDLKPSNVLVTMIDGAPVPKVIDFGVAKATNNQRLTDKTVFTAFEQFIGTPAYMSPEQAEMSGVDIDTRSDIYSLGVVLYELLTGKTPFDAEVLRQAGVDEIRRTIREHDPPKPSTRLNALSKDEATTTAEARQTAIPSLVRVLRGDLDWVVMKCLEKDRNRRYATANGLGTDLRRHLDGEPVVARPPSNLYRLRKLIRRHKVATAAVVALILVTVASVLAAIHFQKQEHLQRQLVFEKRQQRNLALQSLYVAHIRLAWQDWQSGQIGRMVETLQQHDPRAGEPDFRGWEWYYLLALSQREDRTLRGHAGSVNAVATHPTGKWFASGSSDGTGRIWEAESGQPIAELKGHESAVNSVAWSPDGMKLASGGMDRKVILWDGKTFQQSRAFECSNFVWSVVWSPDGKKVAGGQSGTGPRENGGIVTIWDAESGRELHRLDGKVGVVWTLAWHPAGKLLVAGENYRGRLQIWDADGGELLKSFKAHTHYVASVAWSPDGRWLALGSADQQIRIWDSGTWEKSFEVAVAHNGTVQSVAWSASGRWLASAGRDGMIKIWSSTGSLLNTLRGHQDHVRSLCWWKGDQYLVSGGTDGCLKVWEGQSQQGERNLAELGVFAWSPDGRLLAADCPSTDRKHDVIKLVDVATWRTLDQFPYRPNDELSVVAWSPDSQKVAIGSYSGLVQVWDLPTRRTVQISDKSADTEIRSLAWSPDGRQILTSSFADSTSRILDSETLTNVLTFQGQGHKPGLTGAVWHPDGRRVASKDMNGVILIWSPANGQVLHRLEYSGSGAGQPYPLGWSPSGDRLAAGAADGTVIIWDTTTWHQIHRLTEHISNVRSVSWSPDGRRLISGAEDRTVRIWDAESGQELLVLPARKNWMGTVAWHPSGRMIGAWYGSLSIFDATLGYDLAEQMSAAKSAR